MNVYKIGYTKVQRPEGSGQDGVKSVAAASPNAATDALRQVLAGSDASIDVNFNSVQEIAKDVLLPEPVLPFIVAAGDSKLQEIADDQELG